MKKETATKILKYFGVVMLYAFAISLMNQSIWKCIVIAIIILMGAKIQEGIK